MELHAQLHGKLGVRSKVSLAGKHDLNLAYTPGGGAEERGVSELTATGFGKRLPESLAEA